VKVCYLSYDLTIDVLVWFVCGLDPSLYSHSVASRGRRNQRQCGQGRRV
jgi:hypothetical protein